MIEYTVTGSFANLRGGPGTNYAIVDTAEEGDTLFIYDEEPEHEGWLRIWRDDEEDVWIADWLVEKAPQRFYPATQEPLFTASGRGKDITEIFEIPPGAYRIDAVVDDNYFALKSIILDGDCSDQILLNEGIRTVSELNISTLFISYGCSVIFETDNVDGNWQIELRDLQDISATGAILLTIDNETTISGFGRQLTMITRLPSGFWSIQANVDHDYFALRAHVLTGECEDTYVFNESDRNAESLEIETIYRNLGNTACYIFWETRNIRDSWMLTFKKLR